ncbi:DUF1456 family protein [Maribacter sp. HTCC2170]|uniref:DUF1456 family protein n=1 Tax=Maribacter sp. (strain HTCC2170 / KCCM 42371) TaxID=313603 RepID=UPI00006B2164|nr:DUF1456 family protein [Maribacter sp. HTCC2170]EAR00186.1 hypothetical protein FB2170_00930 [Maribacter sp. HTCC2170]
MTNNDIFKKLRVALMLRDDEIVEILKLADFNITKSELGALFRKEDHPNYMECGDQILRNFLNGLVIHLRGTKDNPKKPGEVLLKAKSTNSNSVAKNFDNKPRRKKKFNTDISPVKYKNKKKS